MALHRNHGLKLLLLWKIEIRRNHLLHTDFEDLSFIESVVLRRHCMRTSVLAPLMQKDILQHKLLLGLCQNAR